MSIDYTFYAIVGIKADQIKLGEDVIEKLRNEEVGALIWVDSTHGFVVKTISASFSMHKVTTKTKTQAKSQRSILPVQSPRQH